MSFNFTEDIHLILRRNKNHMHIVGKVVVSSMFVGIVEG